jgi:pimeloyl-ACP methyl ester carboxylesterase
MLLGSTAFGQKSDQLTSMRDLDYGIPTQFINLSNDVELAYNETGTSGEYVIFIHGLASYLPAWKKNVAILSKNNRCISIDLPGYGRSSKGNYNVTMDFFADLINEFCSEKGIQSVTLVGHSMGGQIAITAALKYSKLVNKLVHIAPAGFETFNKGQPSMV